MYAQVGRFEDAQKTLDHLMERGATEHLSQGLLGVTYIAMGRTDEAYAAFDQGLKEKDSGVLFLRIDPWFAKYRSDPRYKRLEEQMPVTT